MSATSSAHDEEVGGPLQVADLDLVVEAPDVLHPRRDVVLLAVGRRETGERLRGAHREPWVGAGGRGPRTAAAPAYVGMDDEPTGGEPLRAGVDGVDGRAVGAFETSVRPRPRTAFGQGCHARKASRGDRYS